MSAVALTLPSFLIGPQAGGRSYGVLRAPGLVARSAAASDRLGDLALSLHRWSRSGEGGLVCFLPLDEGLWALIRAVNLGASELGSVALARGVILRTEDLDAIGWSAHRLMAGLEPPTYALAGAPANAMETVSLAAPPPARADESGIGQLAYSLAHTDRLIETPSDAKAESLLYAILEAAPRNALEGWSAGGLLHRNGRFDPAATFRLVVVSQAAAGLAAAFPRHMPARLADDRLSSADIADPKSWAAWQALFGVKARDYRIDAACDARLAAARWRPEYRDLSPEEVVRRQTVEASQGLEPGQAHRHPASPGAGRRQARRPGDRPRRPPRLGAGLRRHRASRRGDRRRPDRGLPHLRAALPGRRPAGPAGAAGAGHRRALPPAGRHRRGADHRRHLARPFRTRADLPRPAAAGSAPTAAVAMLGALVRAPPARDARRPIARCCCGWSSGRWPIASKPARRRRRWPRSRPATWPATCAGGRPHLRAAVERACCHPREGRRLSARRRPGPSPGVDRPRGARRADNPAAPSAVAPVGRPPRRWPGQGEGRMKRCLDCGNLADDDA